MPPGYGFSEEEDAVAALQLSTHNNECRSGQYPQDIIFRTVFNERLLVPLVEAFARACLQVQTLKKAYLITTLSEPVEFRGTMYDYPVDWGIHDSAPGQYHLNYSRPNLSYPTDSARRRTLTFCIRDWRPSEDLCDLLQSIGQGIHSEEDTVRYLDRWASTGRPQALEKLSREHRD